MSERLNNYIRTYRKQAGLSQRELAKLLGYGHAGPVSRHERLRSLPPLVMAMAYAVVFRISISKLFAGLLELVEKSVENRLGGLETALREPDPRALHKAMTKRKLEWLSSRRNSTPDPQSRKPRRH